MENELVFLLFKGKYKPFCIKDDYGYMYRMKMVDKEIYCLLTPKEYRDACNRLPAIEAKAEYEAAQQRVQAVGQKKNSPPPK